MGSTKAEHLSLSGLLEAFGDRAFGAALFVFAAPNLIPLPPGASAILGAPLVFIAAQLALGRRVLWLPKSIGDRTVATRDYRRIAKRGLPMLRRVERLLAPRLEFLFGPIGDRLIGLVCLTLALVLFLPIPLVNWMPAFAITAFALGIMNRDGVAALVGAISTVLTALLLILVSRALVAATVTFFSSLAAAARWMIGLLPG